MNNLADNLNTAFSEGEWCMFQIISTAWYGKKCYFKQEDGTVLSRLSGTYLKVDDAVEEFLQALEGEQE